MALATRLVQCSESGCRNLTRNCNLRLRISLRKSGATGAGGGTRTRKGLRPETCEVSAFASFATPAPLRLRTVASSTPMTQDLTRATEPHGQDGTRAPTVRHRSLATRRTGAREPLGIPAVSPLVASFPAPYRRDRGRPTTGRHMPDLLDRLKGA